ncbi:MULTISPECIES: response regulator transcription factor [Caballeronia]|jgi:two-component system capsular synthesis response regulator RcsB|uniref:LuxR family transcriptional regulator n=2 Tax=Caballeronia TaxID=1827195 RepID=A0A656QPF7_9BURK|nr:MULTISPECIES: response regulator transcription factor [Caballeronia]EKS68830.1 two component LuxR family transcriptional regulator [Burkholderia sp. SJ98]KDR33066.1 LuxR family transcriptional regulator [Caballeronia zhejiangensis]MCG7399414.1 response regulator transcription factor [Caballeronia zhejiangensis]MCI1042062.1 response regulator transcription factor [Caballeronia zhejiangensis]MDR5791999.1 response regulator transcription factor [Caballeronia sp. LZ008]
MRTRTPKRAIVADDHPVVIKGIQTLLERDGAVRVVATACDTLELAEAIDTTPCDFIFSDIGMRGIDGESSSITFLRRLTWQEKRPKIIVLTMICQTRMLAGLVQLGVDGVIDKRDGLECLHDAISVAEAGGCFLSPTVEAAVRHLPATSPARVGVLSRREWEVFQLYARGLLVHEIAEHFGRSRKTIATQKRAGMRKLGLDSEEELVAYFQQVGLV